MEKFRQKTFKTIQFEAVLLQNVLMKFFLEILIFNIKLRETIYCDKSFKIINSFYGSHPNKRANFIN